MKQFFLIIFSFVMLASCQTNKPIADRDAASEIKPTKNDDGEWDIEVFDDRYDYFLAAVAKPVGMYSESYLKSKNTFLVTEWNSLYYSGCYRNVIESAIDYNPQENYGIKFEYKLYQVFAYVQWRYGLRLNGLSGAEIR